jgi:alpha 1,3-glucosidase
MEGIPVFQRGGSVIPQKRRVRRSSGLMKRDPLTLVVALDGDERAEGTLYVDDEESFDYEKGVWSKRRFVYEGHTLSNSIGEDVIGGFHTSIEVERIIVMGMRESPKSVMVASEGRSLDFWYDGERKELIVKNPKLAVALGWTVEINF